MTLDTLATNLPRPGPLDDQASRLRELVDQSGMAFKTSGRALVPAREPAPHPGLQREAHVIAVASGKGGVGKTNISVNLAIAFAQQGCRAALVDGDLGLGNADVLCGLAPSAHCGHLLEGQRSLQETLITAPGGFTLLPSGSGVDRLADLPAPRRDALLRHLEAIGRAHDVMLIDCGAGIGSGVLAFLQAADTILVVTTPEPTSLADAYALIKCFARRHGAVDRGSIPPDRLLIVVNQVSDADEAARVFARIAAVCRRFLAVEPLLAGHVCTDSAVSVCVRARRPFLLERPNTRASKCVRNLSVDLMDRFALDRCAPERIRTGLAARILRFMHLNTA